MTKQRAGCQWCNYADDCGVLGSGGEGPQDCPVAGMQDGAREPTVRDVIALLIALTTGVNQRFAQALMMIAQHQHRPSGELKPDEVVVLRGLLERCISVADAAGASALEQDLRDALKKGWP